METKKTGNRLASDPLERFVAFLAERGSRLTPQRRLVVETFLHAEGHRSAEEIYLSVKAADPRLGPATVYRTLKLLREAGLAHGMNAGDGLARYEPPSAKGHHDHLICRGCGKIVEFENDQIEALQRRVAEQHGFVVTDHRMELYGICGACRGRGG